MTDTAMASDSGDVPRAGKMTIGIGGSYSGRFDFWCEVSTASRRLVQPYERGV